MNELNNWDEYTINHLITKLLIDAETARIIKDNYGQKAANAYAEDFASANVYRDEAQKHFGQELAYRYAVGYLREMLEANAEVMAMANRTS